MTPDRSKQPDSSPFDRITPESELSLAASPPQSDAERVMRRFRARWWDARAPADRVRVREWVRAVLELLRAHHPHNERTRELVEEAVRAVQCYDAEYPYPEGNVDGEVSHSSRAVIELREAAQAIASAYADRPLLTIRRFCELMHQTDVPRDAFDAATAITLG